MKTVILAINARYEHTSLAPWYLKAAAGVEYEIDIIDAHINQPADAIMTLIRESCPDVLAISCYIWNITMVKRLLPEISRALPERVIILGGPEVSFNSVELMGEFPRLSFIISGEGEKPFADLLRYLEGALSQSASGRARAVSSSASQGRPQILSAIRDLTWRDEGCIRMNDAGSPRVGKMYPRVDESPADESAIETPENERPENERQTDERLPDEPPADESACEPPDPYLPGYFHEIKDKIVYIEASRGCPFSCAFCLSGRRDSVRFFNMDRVKADLLRLANSGAKTVKFVDRTINCNSPRFIELIRYIIDSRDAGSVPDDVCFHFEAAADLFDDEAIGLLRQAPSGLFQLEIGLQSFNETTLSMINRVSDLEKACLNISRLRENNNIHIHLDLICGLPGEDYRSFARSFDRAFALAPHMLQLGFLKLLHGCELRARRVDYGIEHDQCPPYQVTRTAWITKSELDDITLCAAALDRLYNSGRFPATSAYLIGRNSPFAIFSGLGRFIGDASRMLLEIFIQKVMDYNERIPGSDREALRDCLVMDWLSTNRVGVLPVCLKRADKQTAIVKKALEGVFRKSNDPTGGRLSTRRPYGFGLLYGDGLTRVAIADYRERKPPLRDYPLVIVNIDEVAKVSFPL